MRKTIISIFFLIVLFAGQALANDINFTRSIGQGAFRSLSKEAGIALAFKNAAPPHPLGKSGFDAGVELSAIDINKESEYWSKAFNQNAPSYLLIPRLRARKGLPYDIDVGAMYANAGNSNIQLYGLEAGMALLDGSLAKPAIGVRLTYTTLTGVKDLELQTVGLDASIGKEFFFLTPYAGTGIVWIDSKATGDLQRLANLAEEKIWQPRFFAGVEVKPFPMFRLVGELEYALRPIYTLKIAIGF